MIDRKVHKIDATDQVLGRLASRIAIILRGKNKADFQPNQDNGDIVEVANVGKLKFTGKKIETKVYQRHSGYPGGLKTEKLSRLMKEKPEQVLRNAVFHMLPNNKLRANMINRLRIS
ncbi:MAG: 50S ribosomal protein L13 [Patescibacteria group bacterium]